MTDCADPQSSWMGEVRLASENPCFVVCKCSTESFSSWADCSLARRLSHGGACITPCNLSSLPVSWRGQAWWRTLARSKQKVHLCSLRIWGFTWANKWRLERATTSSSTSILLGKKWVLFLPSPLLFPFTTQNLVQGEPCSWPGKGEWVPQDQTHHSTLAGWQRKLGSTQVGAHSGNAGWIIEALIGCCTAQNPQS